MSSASEYSHIVKLLKSRENTVILSRCSVFVENDVVDILCIILPAITW